MSFESSGMTTLATAAIAGTDPKSGVIELADGSEVRVDVMQTYGSRGTKKAAMHDVHQMKVYPYEMEFEKRTTRTMSLLMARVGGLALCSTVVMLVSWQIGIWFALMTK